MIRVRVHRELGDICRDAYQHFQFYKDNPPDEWMSWNTVDEGQMEYELQPEVTHAITTMRRSSDEPIIQQLIQDMSTCLQCSIGQRSRNGINSSTPPAPADILRCSRERHLYKPLDTEVDGGDSGNQAIDTPLEPRRRTGPLRRKRVNDWSQLDPIHYSRPTPPNDVPLSKGPLWLSHDPHFDDYENGPTREDLRSYEDPTCNFPLNPFAKFTVKSCWTHFRDYGYRLLPRFPHMFYLGPPSQVSKHVLRNGVPNNYQPHAHFPNRVLAPILLSRLLYPHLRIGRCHDVTLMGAREMLDSAGMYYTWQSHDLFVRGKTKEGLDVCLDLERDSIDPATINFQPTVDIDSLIWVTCLVKTKLKVQLMLTPTVGRTAPIRKNNHVYFELLMPPTDKERENGAGREWLERKTALSSCPHTLFAKVVDGISIYIFFPRMLHQDEHSGHRITRIPLDIQNLFWNKVVLPALKSHSRKSALPYLDFTVEELRSKSGGKTKPKGDLFSGICKPVDALAFQKIQTTMRDIISQPTGDNLLARFGSFFFVMEAKGIKLYTQEYIPTISSQQQNVQPQSPNPWEALSQQFPHLDLNYMMDQKHGQLVVDIGLSVTPSPKSGGKPVIGLWRLDALDASFGAGGFNQGIMHHTNTLGRYGAIQAEMSAERMRRTHILYRSAYSLHYETTRKKDNQPFFAEDGDAYELNENWIRACEDRENIYKGKAQERCYGVRDEYRVGGYAVKDILTNAYHLVRLVSQSNSSHFFSDVLISFEIF
jgi:hypothetical protein